MGTTTLLVLDRMLLQAIGQYISHPVTTDINADTSIISTHLQNYRNTADYFIDWWVLIEDENNAGVSRTILDDDGTSTLTVRGVSLVDDTTETANFRLSPYSWEQRTRAIIEAIDEIYPRLHRNLDIATLVTGNNLPNAHFENWAASTIPDKYVVANAAATQEKTAGNFRGAESSAKVTDDGSGNGYMGISSDTYPRLLDLAGQTVDVKCWAAPEEADDASIVIITTQADGTTQTFTSTTSNPAGEFTLLVMNQSVFNTDLVKVEIRFKVTTASKFVYFDDARLFGRNIFEHLLPTDFDLGSVAEVWIQTRGGIGGSDTDASDELSAREWERIYGWRIMDDGTDRWLRLPSLFTQRRRIRLIGTAPFETLVDTAPTGTITLDGRRLNLLIAQAKYILYTIVPGIPAVEDIGRFDSAAAKALFDVGRLAYLAMPQKSRNMKLRPIVEDAMFVRTRGRGRF